MKKILILAAVITLTGCSTLVPVKQKFPDVPTELKTGCPELIQTQPTDKLSDVLKVVVDNYGQYHECRIKVDAWIEWYNNQKQIFDSVK